MKPESKTPRTDEANRKWRMDGNAQIFCQELELELANALSKDSLKTREINILTEENRKLAHAVNEQAHDLKQLRDALGCDGSDLPQLLAELSRLQASQKAICDQCGNYLSGHATCGADICTCRMKNC